MPSDPLRRPSRRSSRRAALSAAVAACVLSALATAVADVDVEVGNANKVLGTLAPATEAETLRFRIPGGAKITARAAGARKGPAVSVVLRDPADAPRGTPKPRKKASSVSWTTSPGETGTWTLTVASADGTTAGEYGAQVKWKSPRKFGPTTVSFGESATRTVVFSADLGAKVKVTATSKGDARPRIVAIDGPTGALDGVDDGSGSALEETPRLKMPATGDYTVSIEDTGGGGEVTVKVTVAPPRASKRKVDIRAATLGGGDEQAFARLIGPEGGAVEVPDLGLGGGLDDISGSSIQVPAGTLPSGVSLLIGTTSALDVVGLDDTPLGPTVLFGPEGTTFPQPVTLTIPVDLSGVGGDSSKVRIFVRAANGAVSEVTLTPPAMFDFTSRPGYVSFPVSHFSAYRCVTTSGGGGGPQNPLTLDTVTGATGIAPAAGSNVTGGLFFIAGGGDRTVHVLAAGVSGLTDATYAGGGGLTTDGTDRGQFDFQADVTALFHDGTGTLYVGTPTRLFKVDGNGVVTRIAGTGASGDSGDSGPATSAQFRTCTAILAALNGEVIFTDNASARIRRIDATGNIVTEFGTGSPAFGLDADPVTTTPLLDPAGLAFDPNGGFFVCDGGRVRSLNRGSGRNVTLAGDSNGGVGSSGDGGQPVSALFRRLTAVQVVMNGPSVDSLFVADEGAHTIRRIGVAQNRVDPVAGIADTGASSADGATPPFTLLAPKGLALLGPNLVFLEGDGRVRSYTLP